MRIKPAKSRAAGSGRDREPGRIVAQAGEPRAGFFDQVETLRVRG